MGAGPGFQTFTCPPPPPSFPCGTERLSLWSQVCCLGEETVPATDVCPLSAGTESASFHTGQQNHLARSN